MLNQKIQRMVDEDGSLPAYAWPGGYPLVYYTSNMDTLCATCAVQDEDEDDPIVDCFVHWEGPPIYCVECNKGIESAYGDPEEGGDDE